MVTRLARGLLLKPTLDLLNWILRTKDNSLISGGPLGWSWYSTLAAMASDHHGDMSSFGGTHHAHSQLSGVGPDDHHARDHATRHAVGGGDQVSLDASQIGSGRFGMARMPDGTSGYYLKAQGAGVDPVYAVVPAVPSGLIAMWSGLITNIPSGWVICDGNNGTPNLLAKFVEGVATAGTNPGATGGSQSKTTAGHQHETPQNKAGTANFGFFSTAPYGTGETLTANYYFTGTSTNISYPLYMTKSRTDSIADIRPPYYDIAFIMKT